MTFALRHPSQLFAALILTGCGGAIAWNALVLQNARHPAPLFAQQDQALLPANPPAAALEPAFSQPLPPVRPGAGLFEAQTVASNEQQSFTQGHVASEAGAAPVASVPKSSSRAALTDLIRNGGATAPASQPSPRSTQAAASAARAPTVRDPIAEMIRMGGPVPMPPANVGRTDAGDLVLAGQRALAKLGYGVKVDGIMGPGTRQAVERFEQDRRLTVTGEFNARTVRELSAASGITVQ
jgi:hypothetical protein